MDPLDSASSWGLWLLVVILLLAWIGLLRLVLWVAATATRRHSNEDPGRNR